MRGVVGKFPMSLLHLGGAGKIARRSYYRQLCSEPRSFQAMLALGAWLALGGRRLDPGWRGDFAGPTLRVWPSSLWHSSMRLAFSTLTGAGAKAQIDEWDHVLCS